MYYTILGLTQHGATRHLNWLKTLSALKQRAYCLCSLVIKWQTYFIVTITTLARPTYKTCARWLNFRLRLRGIGDRGHLRVPEYEGIGNVTLQNSKYEVIVLWNGTNYKYGKIAKARDTNVLLFVAIPNVSSSSNNEFIRILEWLGT